MIAVSLKDGEDLVDLFLRKEADVNAKSKFGLLSCSCSNLTKFLRLQRPSMLPLILVMTHPSFLSSILAPSHLSISTDAFIRQHSTSSPPKRT